MQVWDKEIQVWEHLLIENWYHIEEDRISSFDRASNEQGNNWK